MLVINYCNLNHTCRAIVKCLFMELYIFMGERVPLSEKCISLPGKKHIMGTDVRLDGCLDKDD